eukprot:5409866-Pyramimonas_sp.AAC.1
MQHSVRKELKVKVGELSFRVTRWLEKVFAVDVTVSVSSPRYELIYSVSGPPVTATARRVHTHN